ncbi:MAG: alpha/beta hydrolase [Blastocatellia bacterium]
MAIQQRHIVIRLALAFVPVATGLLLIIILYAGYMTHLVTHPPRMPEIVTPQHYAELTGSSLGWSEEKWANKDRTAASGWLLRGTLGAPAIVLAHGYGRNRSELLDMGVRLRNAGYTVLLPDLRGHGASPVRGTSLGVDEGEDLLDAIGHLKSLKVNDVIPVVDQARIGIYGASLGGYAALVAAQRSTDVRAVAVDAVYGDPRFLARHLVREKFGRAGQWMEGLVSNGLRFYLGSKMEKASVEKIIGNMGNLKVWFITSSNAGVYDRTTRDLFARSGGQKELINVDQSRLDLVTGGVQAAYDDRLVAFFRREIPREGLTPVENAGETAASADTEKQENKVARVTR